MKAAIAQRLIDLNKQFYQNLAVPFSASRGRLQPGVLRTLDNIPPKADILDQGCGNGGLAGELARRGHRGQYIGMDFSEELLKIASSRAKGSNFRFLQADLTLASFNQQPEISDQKFSFVFAFAVLHHIPSHELRLKILSQVHGLLLPRAGGFETRPYNGGRFIHSHWQFLNSPRLRARIQPWESIELSAADVDEGDYLLDWRSGGKGLRYVHQFDETELANLAAESGFSVTDSFLSDGKGGKLALYQTWETARATHTSLKLGQTLEKMEAGAACCAPTTAI